MHQHPAVSDVLDYEKRWTGPMINFDDKLPCGVRLQIIRPRPDGVFLLRLTPPDGQTLSNIAQIASDHITIAIDPKNIPALRPVLRALLGDDSLVQRIKNLFQ